MTAGTLPYVDLLDPAGPEMLAARRAHWCARTSMALAVLRYRALAALLSDRRLAQGSHRLLTHQGITEGPSSSG
jgi:hypothetical protein